MEILPVGFQVFREMRNTGTKQSNLHFTGARIFFVGTVFFDD